MLGLLRANLTVPLGQLKPDDVIHDDTRGASITPPKGPPGSGAKPPMAMEPPEKTSVEMALPVLPKKPEVVVENTEKEVEEETNPKKSKFLF